MLVWFPFYLNPVMYLAPVVVAWYGTTMPYVGFMYGNWEANALMNKQGKINALGKQYIQGAGKKGEMTFVERLKTLVGAVSPFSGLFGF